MYIPRNNLTTDTAEIVAFMRQYSFATIITAQGGYPVATHLPFVVSHSQTALLLTSHFARANNQWQQLEGCDVLVIFSEPHAYISPTHYEHEQNVPTWNYVAVHAYGKAKIISDTATALGTLEAMIENYEPEYNAQWQRLSEDFKLKMVKGIVAFEITVTDLQGKKKLSQNKTVAEQQRIINTLAGSNSKTERDIAGYMQHQLDATKATGA